MMDTIKKLFLPSYIDNIVDPMTEDAQREFKATARVAKSHRDLLKRNGVTLQIMVGAGADKHD